MNSNSIDKNEIINLYLSNPYYTNSEIAKMYNISSQYIGRILKPFKTDKKSEIENLYFNLKKNITEISFELQLSAPTVRKILRSFGNRYEEEKNNRKLLSRERARKSKKEYAEQIRRMKKEEQLVLKNLLNLQIQHSLEISTKRRISSKNLVVQNLGHFKYNKDKTSLIFSENWVVPNDFPKRISVKIIRENLNCKLYEKGIDDRSINK